MAAVNEGLHQLRPDVSVMIFPPYTSLAEAQVLCSELHYGAQNCSSFEVGAYTGEVAAEMLASYGCSAVIVGHSERRQILAENEEALAAKTRRALAADMAVVFCVGESLQERESGQAEAVCCAQLGTLMSVLGNMDLAELVAKERVIVAYEPVWAIGTGKTASAEDAQAMHATLRSEMSRTLGEQAGKVQILYGGSVKSANAGQLFRQADIDGALIGGASLDADEFVEIVRIADALVEG
ncbi:triose-phosphate isomerase [Allohahella marinimesophila]|uniref:Triosephosphate isomerase n=2 Tax=Allohahella marinimesophila TaxID=1054972 RepID=A0ABP7Q1C7_9GAMM